MEPEKDITYERTTVSLGKNVYQHAKDYAEKNTMKFSNLIEKALERYLQSDALTVSSDDDDCFITLAREFIDLELRDSAKEFFNQRYVKQSHFLAHIIREAAKALKKLEQNQDWHAIKYTIELNTLNEQEEEGVKKAMETILADIARERELLTKKTG